ncbi:MAG TPA: DUF2817 domain-containing protein [Phycisphaerae bacterium]|nr:DUF2817 domain-containing protein [Phycisphaerae bacterium]HRW53475.1 DUF2817 domain-containing protein [Phycisphaerae bacterium]
MHLNDTLTQLTTRRPRRFVVASILSLGLLSVACVDPKPTPSDTRGQTRSRTRARMQGTQPRPSTGQMRAIDRPLTFASGASQREVVGTSLQGRPIEARVFGSGNDCVFILATIHGNEDAGTPLVERLADYLSRNPALYTGRRVVLMPNANPDGMAAQTRGNGNGVDLNRNYPADNFKASDRHGDTALSEPESVAIHQVLERYQPARIVSIHQPLRYGSECIDHDGPAKALAEAMSMHTDIPVRRIGSRPGSLGSYAGVTLGIPIITLELPKEAKGWDGAKLWSNYGDMLLAAIAYPETLTVYAGQ